MILMFDDWLMKQLEIVPLKLPSIKVTNDDPLIDVEDDIAGETRSVPLTQLLLEKIVFLKLADAETILFDHLDKLTTSQATSLAGWFYKKLNALSDEELKRGNFSRKEIFQGIDDIKRLLD